MIIVVLTLLLSDTQAGGIVSVPQNRLDKFKDDFSKLKTELLLSLQVETIAILLNKGVSSLFITNCLFLCLSIEEKEILKEVVFSEMN